MVFDYVGINHHCPELHFRPLGRGRKPPIKFIPPPFPLLQVQWGHISLPCSAGRCPSGIGHLTSSLQLLHLIIPGDLRAALVLRRRRSRGCVGGGRRSGRRGLVPPRLRCGGVGRGEAASHFTLQVTHNPLHLRHPPVIPRSPRHP